MNEPPYGFTSFNSPYMSEEIQYLLNESDDIQGLIEEILMDSNQFNEYDSGSMSSGNEQQQQQFSIMDEQILENDTDINTSSVQDDFSTDNVVMEAEDNTMFRSDDEAVSSRVYWEFQVALPDDEEWNQDETVEEFVEQDNDVWNPDGTVEEFVEQDADVWNQDGTVEEFVEQDEEVWNEFIIQDEEHSISSSQGEESSVRDEEHSISSTQNEVLQLDEQQMSDEELSDDVIIKMHIDKILGFRKERKIKDQIVSRNCHYFIKN